MPNFASPSNSSLLDRTIWLSFALVILLGLGNIVATNTLATQGVILDDLTGKTISLTKTNHQLELEITRLSNLSYLENTALTLGFKRIRSPLTLETTETVAVIPALP